MNIREGKSIYESDNLKDTQTLVRKLTQKLKHQDDRRRPEFRSEETNQAGEGDTNFQAKGDNTSTNGAPEGSVPKTSADSAQSSSDGALVSPPKPKNIKRRKSKRRNSITLKSTPSSKTVIGKRRIGKIPRRRKSICRISKDEYDEQRSLIKASSAQIEASSAQIEEQSLLLKASSKQIKDQRLQIEKLLGALRKVLTLQETTDENRRRRLAGFTYLEAKDINIMSPGESVLHKRRLVGLAYLEAKDINTMSRSQLATHRRRLKYGLGVNPIMAALMEEIDEAARK